MRIIFYLICVCLILIHQPIKAQKILWQNTISGDELEQLFSIHQTPDGGSICGGYSTSGISGDKSEACQGVSDYWVVKLDISGNIQWQNTIGGLSTDELHSINLTTDGGFICGGFSYSNISGDKTENGLGSADYWVVKLDASGNIQWQNTIGGSSTDLLREVWQTSDGGYICGGYSTSGISGDKTEFCRGSNDYWVVKLDMNGVILWQKVFGGNSFDELFSIKPTSDNGFICAGYSGSGISGEKTELNIGSGDYWILKLDSVGNIEWQNTIGGSGSDIINGVIQTNDGGYLCSGYSYSTLSGDKTEINQGGTDFWLVKLDASGLIQWQNTIGGSNFDGPCNVKQQLTGDYIVCGTSDSPISGDKTLNSKGGNDFWILYLDPSGNIQAQTSIGGNKSDGLLDFDFATDGTIILGGTSNSNISGDKTENNQGNADYWVIKLSNQYNLLSGKMFLDANLNNVADPGESPLPFKHITESNSTNTTFTNSQGEYILFADSGAYSVAPDPIPYYSSVPLTHAGTISGYQQSVSSNDFAFQSSGTFNDLCITISPLGPFRPGWTASYMINYTNSGTTTLTPSILFFPDSQLVYQQSNVTPVSISADSVVWNVPTLAPFESGSILVIVQIDSTTLFNSVVNSSVRIDPVIGDFNPACNYNSWEVVTVGSFDPNDILVNRDFIYDYEIATPPYLEYLIRFQNTGNDTAFYVRIGNNISPDLDITTFEVLASSHPVDLQYSQNSRLMEFTFDNILLPDSNVNEPASHGFMRYRIKPLNSLVVGDRITNRADIYFDFNQPVSTNVAITDIVEPLVISEQQSVASLKLTVYPNPAQDEITIVVHDLKGKDVSLGIYDMFGRKVKSIYIGSLPNDNFHAQQNLSELAGGIYFIRMESTNSVQNSRFVKY